MTTETLAGRLEAVAAARGAAPALAGPDAALDHAGLARAVRGAAGWLVSRGVGPGDRVAWLGFNAVAQVVLVLAAARIGAMAAPLNWRLEAPELAAILADAAPALLVADAAHADMARRVAGGAPVAPAGEVLAAEGEAPAAGDPAAPCLLVYTSGATGRPKGALLSQRAVLANAGLSWDMHAMTPADHVHTVLPMFHVGGLNIQTLPALLIGARVSLMERFEPAACLDEIERLRPSLTVHVPATLAAMMAREDWAARDLSSLRLMATGSTDVPVPLIEAVHARGVPVVQIYGATETGPVAIYQREADARPLIGSIGRPGPGVEARLLDAAGREAEEGEIVLRSPALASGYLGRGAEGFEGGWWRSGDVARRDAAGVFRFTDRIKNVIVSGGENVWPAELERVLASVPGVVEAAVAGVPDARWGAVPVVVAVAPGLGEAEILAAFEGRVARYKRPRRVVFAAALPRNAMGKVERDGVRRLALAAAAPA